MTSKKNLSTLIILSVVVSLVCGMAAGLVGGIFLTPYFNRTIGDDKNLQTIIELNQESATIEVVEKAAPAVVSIVVTKEISNVYNQTGPFWFFDFFSQNQQQQQKEQQPQKQQVGGGTGFIVTADGYIVTNRHVVVDDAAEYSVILNDETQYQATIVDKDTINDIAVLKIEAQNLPILELGDSDQIQIGQTVIAIGYTLGEYKNTVTKGVISGVNRQVTAGSVMTGSEVIEEAIQTDAAINPGNSGGPLLNLQGQAIGINTAVNRDGESIGFAIPINAVKQVVESIKLYGKIVRPWLGVRYVHLSEKIAEKNNLQYDYGAIIVRGDQATDLAIVPGSPADKAGLVENDIILEINGKKLENTTLSHELARYNPGDEIELKIFHDGEEKIVKVKLEERE